GQLDSALTETIQGGATGCRARQVTQRRPEIIVRELILLGAQFRLRARQNVFAARNAGLTAGSFAISDRFYVLRLSERRQAKDQTRHGEPDDSGGIFHEATGFYWLSRPISIGVSGF